MTALIYLGSVPGWSQTTRTEQLRQKRLEKARHLHPPRRTPIEKVLLFLEEGQLLSRFSKGFYWFFPVTGGIKSGAGVAGGVLFFPTALKKHFHFSLRSSISHRWYQAYQGLIGYHDARWSTFGFARYRWLPRERFFGLGPDSRNEQRSDFRIQDTKLGGALGVQFHKNFQTLFQIAYLSNDYGAGQDSDYPPVEAFFTPEQAPGLGKDVEFIISKFLFRLDFRNVKSPLTSSVAYGLEDDPLSQRHLNPSRGSYLALEASHFEQQGSDLFDFNRLDLEIQQYLSFYHGHQVIALRGFLSVTDKKAGARVPFYLMQSLGGGNSLRGYHTYRFRDNHVLLWNAEYRWQAWHLMEVALFFDAGKTVARRKQINFNRMATTYGFDFRFRTPQRVMIRVGLGVSRENTLVYLKFNNSF